MKRILAALAIALAVLPQAVHAEELWRMDKFRSDIAVGADGVVEVTETIDVDFLTARHGIYRYIPTQGRDDSGRAYALSIRAIAVMRDGRNEHFDASRSGDNLVWRIGYPDITLTGTHEYVIRYAVTGGIGRFQDFDELYWNVSGEGWDVPLPIVAATVILPPGVEEQQSACYTGPYGSKESDCQVISAGGQVGFVTKTPGKPLTVAVGFPKGVVAGTAVPVAPEPSGARSVGPFSYGFASWPWWLLPIATFLFMYLRWRKKGDDPDLGPVVAEYEPPEGLRPAETTAVLRQATDRMAVASTIVDLAVRGYLRIEETKTDGLFGTGLGSSKDHVLHQLKAFREDATLKPFEKRLLEALFTGPMPAQVSVSRLVEERFYEDAKELRSSVMAQLASDGYFEGNPEKIRNLPMAIGIVAAIIPGIFVFMAPALIVTDIGAWLAAGVIIAVFGYFMGKWSPKGVEAAKRARGYREFISKVEKYRAPWMETQEIFEKTLPYAMAFGLGSRWAKAFASLNIQPPNWYAGANAGAWSALTFADSIDAWSRSMVAASSPPRSSGSGSGGGGFSGGGGGGGGGGSW